MSNVHRARGAILAGVLLFLSGGAAPRTDLPPEVIYGPQEPTQEEIAEIQAAIHRAEYHAQLWSMVVDKIAGDLRIEDRDLAERIAKAIDNSSAEFDVDPWLMIALIRVESMGDPEAVSRVGALGLTQVMPATGKQIAKELGVEWTTAKEVLFDVETNVRFGTYYLSTLLKRFDGDTATALAAYNWGPGHIAMRIKRGKPLPVVYPGKVLRRVSSADRPWKGV